jgi:hypothetical protein
MAHCGSSERYAMAATIVNSSPLAPRHRNKGDKVRRYGHIPRPLHN